MLNKLQYNLHFYLSAVFNCCFVGTWFFDRKIIWFVISQKHGHVSLGVLVDCKQVLRHQICSVIECSTTKRQRKHKFHMPIDNLILCYCCYFLYMHSSQTVDADIYTTTGTEQTDIDIRFNLWDQISCFKQRSWCKLFRIFGEPSVTATPMAEKLHRMVWKI